MTKSSVRRKIPGNCARQKPLSLFLFPQDDLIRENEEKEETEERVKALETQAEEVKEVLKRLKVRG